jgi:hypothetical protein
MKRRTTGSLIGRGKEMSGGASMGQPMRRAKLIRRKGRAAMTYSAALDVSVSKTAICVLDADGNGTVALRPQQWDCLAVDLRERRAHKTVELELPAMGDGTAPKQFSAPIGRSSPWMRRGVRPSDSCAQLRCTQSQRPRKPNSISGRARRSAKCGRRCRRARSRRTSRPLGIAMHVAEVSWS